MNFDIGDKVVFHNVPEDKKGSLYVKDAIKLPYVTIRKVDLFGSCYWIEETGGMWQGCWWKLLEPTKQPYELDKELFEL